MPEILLSTRRGQIPLWIALNQEDTENTETEQHNFKENHLPPGIREVLEMLKQIYGIIYIGLYCEISKKTYIAHTEASIREEGITKKFESKATHDKKDKAHLGALHNLHHKLELHTNKAGYYLMLEEPLLPIFFHHPHISSKTVRPEDLLGWLNEQRKHYPIREATLHISKPNKFYKVRLGLFFESFHSQKKPFWLCIKKTGANLPSTKAMAFNALAEELRAHINSTN